MTPAMTSSLKVTLGLFSDAKLFIRPVEKLRDFSVKWSGGSKVCSGGLFPDIEIRPIFPNNTSGEEGWCFSMASLLSANGCFGGGVTGWASGNLAKFLRDNRSSSGGGGGGGS